MKSFKQLWLSVAREVLERTKDGDVHFYIYACNGIRCNMVYGICDLSMICARVSYFPADVVYKWLSEKFVQWPKFSGSIHYPVPSADWRTEVYMFGTTTPTQKWSPFHPYGALRRELLEFLIQEMEKEEEAKWRIDT